jgi:hypothetical protein
MNENVLFIFKLLLSDIFKLFFIEIKLFFSRFFATVAKTLHYFFFSIQEEAFFNKPRIYEFLK